MVTILSQPLNGFFCCLHFTKVNSHAIMIEANNLNQNEHINILLL